MDEYSFEKLQSNCNGGIVENYICQSKEKNSNGKARARLVQSIEMGNERVVMNSAEHKLGLIQDLDNNLKTIDFMKEFICTHNKIFVVHDFLGQGYKDLYMLANIKGNFSESEIG